jgi:antitoxin PrlF
MNAVFSKITSKSQTVIPREVRDALRLKPGDRLRYAITNKGILIDRAETALEDDPFAVFTEWNSEADEKAYGNL